MSESIELTPEMGVQTPISTNQKYQIVAASIASLLAFCGGTVLAWTPPTKLNISPVEHAVLIGTFLLGAILASLSASVCANLFGRKTTMLIIGCSYSASHILASFAANLNSLIVTRLIAGAATAATSVVVPVYIGETCSATLGILYGIMEIIGFVYTSLLSDIFEPSLGCAVIAILATGSISFIAESPFYLIDVDRVGKARKALWWLYENDEIVNHKFHQLQKEDFHTSFRKVFKEKGFLSCLGLFVHQQFCGIIFVADKKVLTAALLIGIVLAVIIIPKRLPKLSLSAIFLCVSFLTLSVCHQINPSKDTFLTNLCQIVILISYPIGIGTLPNVLLIKTFKIEQRGKAASVITLISYLTAILTRFGYPALTDSIGLSWLYSLMALQQFGGLLFIRVFIERKKADDPGW